MFDFIAKLFKGRTQVDAIKKPDYPNYGDHGQSQPFDGTAALSLAPQQEFTEQINNMDFADIDNDAESFEPENFFQGSLTGEALRHEMYARKAGISHWSKRSIEPQKMRFNRSVDAMQNDYFEQIKNDPHLRSNELNNPGTSLEPESYNQYIKSSLKNKLIGQYVQRSQNVLDEGLIEECEPEPEIELEAWAEQSACSNPLSSISTALEELTELHRSIMELSAESDPEVRVVIAQSAGLPEVLYEILSCDENLDIKYGVAENYTCPQNILEKLAEDDNPYVACRAKKTLDRLTASKEKREFTDVLSEPAQSHTTDIPVMNISIMNINDSSIVPEVREWDEVNALFGGAPTRRSQNKLPRNANSEQRNGPDYTKWLLAMAEAANTREPREDSPDIDTIWMLLEDENLDVRFALAENYNIDDEMLEVLTLDENPYVSHRARKTLARKTGGSVISNDFSSNRDYEYIRRVM